MVQPDLSVFVYLRRNMCWLRRCCPVVSRFDYAQDGTDRQTDDRHQTDARTVRFPLDVINIDDKYRLGRKTGLFLRVDVGKIYAN